MNKRYLLIIKNKFSIDTLSFYTLEEATIAAKNENYYSTSIIDLEDNEIKWKGFE
ncbi:hypothetical protein [Spiroplasma endosymbiont of Phyllotreta cruciferae]|uniref:hypothetical protein n=1 Tax=Spiroplasma endosymbiont of Phyllotreta cruciferae TaxID=2886375 RepID=UPI00209DBD99|nr:hypothetical protein [Spiroplasma endosymbiont of Phyllotreta cruciferae]